MGKFFSVGNAKSYSNSLGTVKDILDINLIKLTSGETIRLIGVVPPKITHSEGIDFLKELVLGKTVTLEYDKNRKDKNRNILAFMYFNSGKNFEAIKGVDIIEKYSACLSGFESSDEMEEQPEDLFLMDAQGNKCINPEVAKAMKPNGDLYLQLNLTLIGCGFADFKSMPPDICMDSLFKSKYKEASENRLGIWAV